MYGMHSRLLVSVYFAKAPRETDFVRHEGREFVFKSEVGQKEREGHTFTPRILWNDSIRKRRGFSWAPACAAAHENPCLLLPGRCLIYIPSLGDILKVSCTTVVHAAAKTALQRDVPCIHTAGIGLTLCPGSEVDSPGPMIALLFLQLVSGKNRTVQMISDSSESYCG